MHANARLTERGRRILVDRIAEGRPISHVAAEMGVSRTTATRWWRRFQDEGPAGLADRPSRPRTCPHRTAAPLERQVLALRRARKLGPARIGSILGMPTSTVHRVLTRHRLNRLAWIDRPSGEPIRRITTSAPGELVHVDVKKLGRIPPGGGWRAFGRSTEMRQGVLRVGFDYVHSAIDAHTRLAYSEVLADERGPTCAQFWARAAAFFAGHGVEVRAVLSDNARNYIGHDFTRALGGVEHRRIRPYRPQTNGKIERFNRTLLEEWAYVRTYRSNDERTRALDRYLHIYNHHRGHTALGGRAPIDALNVPGQHI